MKRMLVLIFLFAALMPLAVMARPIVVLTTDFGIYGDAVGLCHGAILAVDPDIEVVDLCHTIQPFNIRQAAFTLKRTQIFPRGSVFVSVVDPGVGTKRTSIAVRTQKGLYYIAPNNGLLTFIVQEQGVDEVYELDPKKVNPMWNRGTFDGRDLYGPAGALLASSCGNLDRLGKLARKEDIVLLNFKKAVVHRDSSSISGTFIQTDAPYGNIWTNITKKDLDAVGAMHGDILHITSGNLTLEAPFVSTFGDVAEGSPLAYLNSDDCLAMAINLGNFKYKYQLEEGADIIVTRKESSR